MTQDRKPTTEPGLFRERFTRFLKAVIEPAVHGETAPLEIAAWQTPNRVTPGEASRQRFTPVKPGFRWGPKWSTCWFRVRGTIPAELAGKPVDLRFRTGTEATIYAGGTAVRGLDAVRDTFTIAEAAEPGAPVDLLIEAACNHPFGIVTFDWDTQDTIDRWHAADPGHLTRADLAARHPAVASLAEVYRFAARLLTDLDEHDPAAEPLYDTLRRTTIAIDDQRVEDTAAEAERILRAGLAALPAPAEENTHPHGIAVGHAHIDTAWLWPIAETRRKVIRSWANALECIDRHDRFTFIASQAQQYAYVEEDSPELFARITAAVEAGRWQPTGGMWIEPDVSVPSGESLIRQVLTADRYWRARFGDAGAQNLCYLPDTFGFPASLPDILLACGLDTFVTNKISWNQATPYPHTSFAWRGLGGGKLAAHFTPNHDYNCVNTPAELRRTARNIRGDAADAAPFLHPFGYGDGGGGPTPEMARAADLSALCPALPTLEHAGIDTFRERLHAGLGSLPEHAGELYLELHRGTLTTHPWLKQANRAAEEHLRLAEWRLTAEHGHGHAHPETREHLDRAWKLLLLQQFHDILPGSSIPEVYDDARADLAEIGNLAAGLFASSTDAGHTDNAQPAILNPASTARGGVVEVAGEPVAVKPIPPLARMPLERAEPANPVRIDPDNLTLDNGLISARLDPATGLIDLASITTPTAKFTGLNDLRLYRDIPMNWDAWDIDAYYEEELRWSSAKAAAAEITPGPAPASAAGLRATFRVVHCLPHAGTVTQIIRLDADSPRLDIITTIDWDAEHRLLRAEFPTDLAATTCDCGIQFGHTARRTTRDTLAERMAFELCCHRWLSLADRDEAPTRGLALLSPDRFGHSAHAGRLGLSLMRAPTHPDPNAGRERAEFTYALMPHAGDWAAAHVDREAEALARPLVHAGTTSITTRPVALTFTGDAAIEIAALKPAEDNPADIVLRLVETRGKPGRARVTFDAPIASAHRVNAIERDPAPLDLIDNGVTLDVRPFEIITLLVRRA